MLAPPSIIICVETKGEQSRRFLATTLDNAYAVALHFMHYNFCRVHKTLGTTPAVAAGVADHEWTIEEVINLLESK